MALGEMGMRKVLQVNGYQLPGQRFNGLSIKNYLWKAGIDSKHLIWRVDSINSGVRGFGGIITKIVNFLTMRLEHLLSLQSVLYPHALQMLFMKEFKEADLIHLHIIHSGYLSLGHLPLLTSKKATIWTIHDPWAITGHCIYPINCQKWQDGCGGCPDLKSQLPLRFDKTNFLFNYKKRAYEKSRFEVVVASEWMKNIIATSPMLNGVKVHKIPFGINLDFFSPDANPRAREKFNIEHDEIVISFRALDNDIKGFKYIVKALELIHSNQKICLLTLNQSGILDQFKNRFKVIDLGWINDDEVIRDVYLATDIFLMPSEGEAFGMMAIEAMACAKPLIVFEGTALPETCFAPDVGIAVPMRDYVALAEAIQNLIDTPSERILRGQKGREMAMLHYDEIRYANEMADLYNSILDR